MRHPRHNPMNFFDPMQHLVQALGPAPYLRLMKNNCQIHLFLRKPSWAGAIGSEFFLLSSFSFER